MIYIPGKIPIFVPIIHSKGEPKQTEMSTGDWLCLSVILGIVVFVLGIAIYFTLRDGE